MMTAEEALFRSVSEHKSEDGEGGLHASHTENTNDSHLGLPTHTQIPNEEDGQNAHGEITYRRKRTVHIGHGNDDLNIHAMAGDRRVESGSGPEIF